MLLLWLTLFAAATTVHAAVIGPECEWELMKPVCRAKCRAVCAEPQCTVVCTGPSPHPTCQTPRCTTDCPTDVDQIATDSCPMCTTDCSALSCASHPPSVQCQIECQVPQCGWVCAPPTSCPKPHWELVCAPPVCAFQGTAGAMATELSFAALLSVAALYTTQ